MIEIIKAEEKHAREIGNLWWEFMKYSQGIDLLYTPEDDSIPIFIKDYLHPAMEDKNSLVLVEIENEKVIGYSYSLIIESSKLEKREKYGCIHDMFITAGSRRTRRGGKMLDEIYKWFRQKGVKRIELDVLEKNTTADSFWRKQGFTDSKHTLYRNI